MDEKQNVTVQENPAPLKANPVEKKESESPVGFWPFVGLIVLFSVPVIGWIAALVFLLVSKNKNVKNFSGAQFAVMTVQFLASLLVSALLLSAILGLFLPVLNNALGTNFSDPYELFATAGDLAGGKYSKALKRMIPTITAMGGEELKPFLEELSSGKYEKLLHQIAEEQYRTVLNDFENGEYPELVSKLDPEAYDFMIGELRKEVEGPGSEIIDRLEDFIP